MLSSLQANLSYNFPRQSAANTIECAELYFLIALTQNQLSLRFGLIAKSMSFNINNNVIHSRRDLRSRVITLLLLLLAFSVDIVESSPHVYDLVPEVTLSQPLTIRWRYDSGLSLNLTPAFDAERIYLPLAGGIVVALRARDGQLYWRSEMGGELSASPVADGDQV